MGPVIGSLFLALSITPAWAFQNGGADRTQSRLEREVRYELLMLPYYSVFDNLAYRVDGGTVTLFGQVTRPTLKDDAEREVKKIEGVERDSTGHVPRDDKNIAGFERRACLGYFRLPTIFGSRSRTDTRETVP